MNRTLTFNAIIALARSVELWNDVNLPALTRTIPLKSLSPAFDPNWRETGAIDAVCDSFANWVRAQGEHLTDLVVETVQLDSSDGKRRTPLLFIDIPSTLPGATEHGTVLLYGHMDKQPEFQGWDEGYSAWSPVFGGLEVERLYGRGTADDGYAIFAAVTALRLLREQDIPHPRCVILIEAAEESGSPDLPSYMEHLAERIGRVDLVFALDSGCGDYERLWLTTSLRGIVMGDLKIELLTEGIHSGAGGIVPDISTIERRLLDRVHDCNLDTVTLADLDVQIPDERIEEAHVVADILGESIATRYPLIDCAKLVDCDGFQNIIYNTWDACMNVIGREGVPKLTEAGNVLKPALTTRIAIRIPPTLSAEKAKASLKKAFETEPPYGARVSFTCPKVVDGWHAPPLQPWLKTSLDEASNAIFGNPMVATGEGGCIPFMGMLGKYHPEAQLVITGVLGPGSNAHGPNEFLHIPTAERLTTLVAMVIADYANQ